MTLMVRRLLVHVLELLYRGIRYDTIAEFNVDSIAECSQLNLARETKSNQTNDTCLLS